LSVTCHR